MTLNNGFIHFLNPLPTTRPAISSSPPIACYVTESTREDSPDFPEDPFNTTVEPPTPYSAVPWSETAILADIKLIKVQDWLETLERPNSLSDSEYKSFMCYCTKFFIVNDRLW